MFIKDTKGLELSGRKKEGSGKVVLYYNKISARNPELKQGGNQNVKDD